MAEVALGRMRSPDRAEGPNMIPYLRAANVKDGSLDLSDVKSMDFNPSEQAVYALRVGDVLVTEGAGSLAAVGASAVWSGEIEGVVCFQNTLLRLRPRGNTNTRYLMWWARHAYGSGLLASVAEGANIYHLGADNVRLLPASVPDPTAQQRIVDYLDSETARLDALVAAYSELARVCHDRAQVDASMVFDGEPVPLKRLVTKIGSGKTPLGGAEVYVDDGVPFIRSMNVRMGYVDLTDLARIDRATDASMSSTRLRPGDVLLNITGASIGRCALVPSSLAPANVNQHVCILRPRSEIPGGLLAAALQTPDVQAQIRSVQVGGNRDGLTFEQVAGLQIRWPRRRDPQSLVAASQAKADWSRRVGEAIARQLGLLLERRQAIITAAITGQLKISGVTA